MEIRFNNDKTNWGGRGILNAEKPPVPSSLQEKMKLQLFEREKLSLYNLGNCGLLSQGSCWFGMNFMGVPPTTKSRAGYVIK